MIQMTICFIRIVLSNSSTARKALPDLLANTLKHAGDITTLPILVRLDGGIWPPGWSDTARYLTLVFGKSGRSVDVFTDEYESSPMASDLPQAAEVQRKTAGSTIEVTTRAMDRARRLTTTRFITGYMLRPCLLRFNRLKKTSLA